MMSAWKATDDGRTLFTRLGGGSPSLALKSSLVLLAALFSFCAHSQSASDKSPGYVPVRSLQEIRTEGVIIQRWDNSCAAAALATVLTYGFDDPLAERDVAKGMLGRTDPVKVKVRGGFSFLDMKRFVESRGYEGTGYGNMRIEDLLRYQSPILPVEVHGYPHFVVFKGVKGDHVLLADPSFGNRSLSVKRFLQAWQNGLAFVVLRGDR